MEIPIVKKLPLSPAPLLSLIPILFLLAALGVCILTVGADSVLDLSPYLLISAALIALVITRLTTRRTWRHLFSGLRKSGRQILPAYPILMLIGTLSATWMISGVVPMLIDYGLQVLNPRAFLPLACLVCAVVSVVTGSSWTTIATIGVALLGIGTVMGYSAAWVAGAIISGAYFGDKISPLSDTTVLAASTVGVDLFSHIRNMMITTVPAMMLAIAGYAIVGWTTGAEPQTHISEMATALSHTFNLSPWLMVVPALTVLLIILRVNTVVTLAVASLAGLAAAFIFQPGLIDGNPFLSSIRILAVGSQTATGNASLDALISTAGIAGMLPTIGLVTAAMIFGGMMIGSGMLASLTRAFIRRLSSRRQLVSATVGGGIFLNATTGDQYISLIIGGNLYRAAYLKARLRPHTLSRTLEDSISVTSVLIPWNSCGMTQSAVLGVATIAYAPCCLFNILSPIMSLAVAWLPRRLPRLSLSRS